MNIHEVQNASKVKIEMSTDEVKHHTAAKEIFFSPASIVAIYNAHLSVQEERRIIKVRGIFKKTGNTNYGGFYYNRLKDEASENSITLITSALMHHKLDDNKTIEFNGFVTKRLDKLGRIELIINVIDLISQHVNKFSEEEIKKILLINKKVAVGFKDLDAHIKNSVFNNKRLSVKIIMGKAGIINSDINKSMEAAIALYDIEYHKVSLSAPAEIIEKIKMLDTAGTDVICVARGGGENLEIFENLELCNAIIEKNTIIASAIGHADDVTLFEKLSDKKFITPTQFGNYLKEIYNTTIEEFENSKAKLINDISATLKVSYDKQVMNLNEKIASLADLKAKELSALSEAKSQTEEVLKRSLMETQRVTTDEKQSLNNQLKIVSNEVERKNKEIFDKEVQMQFLNKNILDLNKRLLEISQIKPPSFVRALVIGLIIGFLIAILIFRLL